MMPPHRLYVESHLGGGAVMQRKRSAHRNIGIDLDPQPLATFAALNRTDVTLLRGDAVDLLATLGLREGDLVYADPPYLRNTRRQPVIYRHEYSLDDHERLLALLLELPCYVLISGYRSALYDSRLASWLRHDFHAVTQIGLVAESIWSNFAPSAELHDYRFIGDDFRDREAIKRRRTSYTRRLQALPEIERLAIFSEMADSFPEEFRLMSQRTVR